MIITNVIFLNSLYKSQKRCIKLTKKKNPIALLLKWAGKDKIYLIFSILCSFISGFCTIIPYYGIYRLIDAVYTNSCTQSTLFHYALLIGIGVTIRFGLFGLSGILSHKGAYNSLFKVRCMVTEHMAKMPLGILNERNTGEIKTILNENIEKLELFLAHHLPEFIFYFTGPIAIFIYLCTINLPLALLSLIPILLSLCIMGIMFKGSSSLMDKGNKAISSLNAAIIEYIHGMRLIKAYNLGSNSFKKYSKAVESEHEVWTQMSKKMGPPYAAYVVVLECGLLLMVPIGGLLFLKGSLSANVFILFAFIGSLYLTEIRPLQELGSNFAQVLNGIHQVDNILNEPSLLGQNSFPKDHDIEVKNVSFSYDGKIEVLKNCNLSIQNGKRLAIVGVSGGGKTTLVQLIARFYDIQHGEILIGGKNVKDINYEELLNNISIVFQQTFLTRGSVLENIRMGKKATLSEVREAAKKAQIDNFIMNLPDGYNTLVGNYGSRFSGGEKQRIAIARAILKNAPILILDEATSAADPENQVEIDKAIKNLCKGKTVIIVAHRLSVVKDCDYVAVIDNHTVSCMGTHGEILKKSSYYKNAWQDYNIARELTYTVKGDAQNAR